MRPAICRRKGVERTDQRCWLTGVIRSHSGGSFVPHIPLAI
jgi:hypothetical protein